MSQIVLFLPAGVISGPTQNFGAVRKVVSILMENKQTKIALLFKIFFYLKFPTGTANSSSNIVKHLLHFDPELQKGVKCSFGRFLRTIFVNIVNIWKTTVNF